MNDSISKILNLTPVVPEKNVPAPAPKTIHVDQTDDQVENDFEYARRNMYDIIEKGNEALHGIMDVAGQSQHPRAYEVAANLIKTMAETNKDLLELTKKKRELAPKEAAPAQQMANNMAVFVGSTSELQAMLTKKKTEE